MGNHIFTFFNRVHDVVVVFVDAAAAAAALVTAAVAVAVLRVAFDCPVEGVCMWAHICLLARSL